MTTRVFTGLKPTGQLQLGNYLGAIKPLLRLAADPGNDVLACVVDLHALTVGHEPARLRELTLEVYRQAEAIARERGIILADTKLEFGARTGGADAGTIVLGDEVLTPDSSRFWPADRWSPGRSQPSYDKQIVRDWLTSPASGWSKESGEQPPPLPDDVVEHTRAKYLEAFERLTGQRF